MSESSGLLANRYRLSEAIGRGGMADVFAARDETTGEMVAVKVMRIGEAADPDRFESEMRVLDRLDHHAIVRLFDSGTTSEENPYFVMQLVDGESLSARLRATGPLESDDVALIGARVASALAHAHERGVIHRDIKPANILLQRDGSAFLTDFGVARLADATTVTRAGTTIGTAAYLAPEQLQDSAVGPAADVYSLGLVLLEALTGRRAFRGTGVEAAMARLSLDPVIPELEGDWTPLLIGMTRRDPSRRLPASVVSAVLEGDQPPPALDPDERESRTMARSEGDDEPTAVSPPPADPATPPQDSSGSGAGWAPPGVSGDLPRAAAPRPAAAAPEAPVDAAAASARPPVDPAAAAPASVVDAAPAAPTSAAEPAPAAQPDVAATPPPSPPPVAGDAASGIVADARPSKPRSTPSEAVAEETAPVPAPLGPSEPGPPVDDERDPAFTALRGPLLAGVLIGAALMFVVITGLVLLRDTRPAQPTAAPSTIDVSMVEGTDPVDDAAREVLRVLEASEVLGAADPALQRNLRLLYDDIAVAVNADAWEDALLATLSLSNEARAAVASLDIEGVALEGLLGALRQLTTEIQLVVNGTSGGE